MNYNTNLENLQFLFLQNVENTMSTQYLQKNKGGNTTAMQINLKSLQRDGVAI